MVESHVMTDAGYFCADKGGTYTETTEYDDAIRCVACGAPIKAGVPPPPVE